MAVIEAAQSYTARNFPSFDSSPASGHFGAVVELFQGAVLDQQWEHYQPRLVAPVTVAFPIVVQQLETMIHVPDIGEDEIQQVLSSVIRLEEVLKASKLPSGLTEDIQTSLAQFKDRLSRFDIFGADGFTASAQALIGLFVMSKSQLATDRSVSSVSAALRTLLSTFGARLVPGPGLLPKTRKPRMLMRGDQQ